MQPETEYVSNTTSNSDDSTAHEEDLSSSDSSSESSESSGYSDWVADHGVNLEPPKRSKRKPINRCIASTSTASVSNNEEKKVTNKANKKVRFMKRNILEYIIDLQVVSIPKLPQGGEVPDIYKPLEWLAETKPRKAPYCPQMGDEIVYFRQGHQLYIDAIREKKVYEVNPKDVPWMKGTIKVSGFCLAQLFSLNEYWKVIRQTFIFAVICTCIVFFQTIRS